MFSLLVLKAKKIVSTPEAIINKYIIIINNNRHILDIRTLQLSWWLDLGTKASWGSTVVVMQEKDIIKRFRSNQVMLL